MSCEYRDKCNLYNEPKYNPKETLCSGKRQSQVYIFVCSKRKKGN